LTRITSLSLEALGLAASGETAVPELLGVGDGFAERVLSRLDCAGTSIGPSVKMTNRKRRILTALPFMISGADYIILMQFQARKDTKSTKKKAPKTPSDQMFNAVAKSYFPASVRSLWPTI
jgi:hypothetical protein